MTQLVELELADRAGGKVRVRLSFDTAKAEAAAAMLARRARGKASRRASCAYGALVLEVLSDTAPPMAGR